VIDLIAKLNAKVILVSRNYLGSINHSILTAEACKARNLDVAGWIFNDQYMHYESEIARWSGYPSLASVPFTENPDKGFVQQQAVILRSALQNAL
jgi:dethiobiotin synthetase